MSLANTLVASSVLATLAFTTASLTVSQLTLNSRLGNQKIARELAESAASDCLHQLMLDPDWKGDSHITLATAPGGWGRASFSPSVASQWGIPPSTNHLQGKLPGSSVADGSSLPASSLQLIAVGNYRGQRIRVVQMLLIPPFKYALSSSGAIVSNGGLTVGSVDDPALLANGFGSLPDDLIKAGHLAGNQSGPDSVHLNASPTRPVVIKGDVDSAGSVQKTDDAKVLGGIKENRQPVPLPSIPVHDYDPKDRSDLVKLEDPTQAHLVVKKPVRRQGALKITSGLEMTEGYLYVDGDLDIYGGISGKGAIFATGSIKIHGVSNFAANNQQAIVAGGDVSVEGLGRDRSTFQGVIYTEGNFRAKDITLVGALVGNKANDAQGDGSQMTLDACNLLYNRQVLNNVWSSGFDPGQEPSTLNLPDDLRFATTSTLFGGADAGKPLTFALDPKASDFYDPEIDQYRADAADRSAFQMAVFVPRSDGGTERFANMDEAIRVLGTPHHGLPIAIPPDPAEVAAVREANARLATTNWLRKMLGLPPLPLQPEPTSLPTWVPSVQIQLRTLKGLMERSSPISLIRQQILEQDVEKFNEYYLRTKPLWMRHGEFGFSLNPNQFLSLADKARRVSWSDE